MSMRRFSIVLIASCLFFATSENAGAYCLNKYSGQKQFARWTKNPVTYRVSSNLKDAKILAAIDAAFATWAAQSCTTLRFKKGSTFSISEKFEHGVEEIRVYWFTQAQGFPSSAQYIAYTFTGHNNIGGLVQGSIAVNAFNQKWATDGSSSQYDAQGQLTSLIGQVIGFTYSNKTDSVIQQSVSPGDVSRRTLGQDDIDALHHHYNGGSCPAAPHPGADGCTGSAPAPDGGPTYLDIGVQPRPDYGTGPRPDMGVSPDRGTTPQPDSGYRFDTGANKQCQNSTQCANGEVCTAEGQCVRLGGCRASSECGSGMICSAEGRCEKLGDGGCAVDARGADQLPWMLAGLVLVALVTWRRRGTK
jgi:hypothetical protein